MEKLQIPLFIVSVLVLIFVLWNIIKNHMDIGYAMVWIMWSLGMIFISIFPQAIVFVGNLLGIQLASNAVFLMTIFLLYCLTFYLFLRISKHNEQIVDLNYEISTLKKTVEEMKRNERKNKK